MKIRIGKYVWNPSKCIPLYLFAGIAGYKLMWILYYLLLPYSTMA